jgi:hypothetical protein
LRGSASGFRTRRCRCPDTPRYLPVQHRGTRPRGESWGEFASRIDDLQDKKSPILLRYYSGDRLFSDEARERFVEPDLDELPALN